MGLFQNISSTRMMADANYPKYGAYWVRIDKVKRGETRKKMINLIIDYTVIAVLPSSEPEPHHIVGEEACHYIEVSGNDYAAADWAGFIAGMLGCKVEDLDNPEIRAAFGNQDSDDWATSERQPLRGTIGQMRARMVMTKGEPNNPSHPFTKVRWMREVPAAEVLKALAPELVTRFFPGQMLERAAGLVK